MLSTVSLTPAINCLLVSTTPAINCIDDRGLLSLQNYLRPPKSATAAKVGHGCRYCHWKSHENTQRHLTNPDQRPRRPPKLLQTKTALFSFGGLRGLWSRCVGCFWMQLFMAVQWHHRRPWPTSAAGDIADLSPSTFSYTWQLPTSMASLFLWPAINLSPVTIVFRCHRRKSYRRCRCHRQQSYCRCRCHRW